MASLSSPTTSSPSQSVALKPLVHVSKIPCTHTHTITTLFQGKFHVVGLKTTRLPPVKPNQLISRCFSTVQQRGRKEEWRSYSVQAGLFTGEGEGEAQRKTSVLHAHVVEEVTDTLHDVIKQLEENKYNNV